MADVDLGNCAFCGFELTENDLPSQSPLHWHRCCRDQTCQNAATYPQIWLLKKELGKPYEEPPVEERVCMVCNAPLTEMDFNRVEKSHVNFTCIAHRNAVMDINPYRSREKYGYTEVTRLRILQDVIKIWGF